MPLDTWQAPPVEDDFSYFTLTIQDCSCHLLQFISGPSFSPICLDFLVKASTVFQTKELFWMRGENTIAFLMLSVKQKFSTPK